MNGLSTQAASRRMITSQEQKPPVTWNTGLAVETVIEESDSSMDAASTETDA